LTLIYLKSSASYDNEQVASRVFELLGRLGVELSNCFLNPPNTLSNYVQGGQLYTVHIRFTSQFCSVSDRQKVQSPSSLFTIQTLSKYVLIWNRFPARRLDSVGGPLFDAFVLWEFSHRAAQNFVTNT